jgi:hypothetical protein
MNQSIDRVDIMKCSEWAKTNLNAVLVVNLQSEIQDVHISVEVR